VSGGHVALAGCEAGFALFGDCAALFADGFEYGDSSLWSATVP
jgi:hypothetical protein